MKLTEEAAIRQTLELTKANLENVDAFVHESAVISFMKKVYSFLKDEESEAK